MRARQVYTWHIKQGYCSRLSPSQLPTTDRECWKWRRFIALQNIPRLSRNRCNKILEQFRHLAKSSPIILNFRSIEIIKLFWSKLTDITDARTKWVKEDTSYLKVRIVLMEWRIKGLSSLAGRADAIKLVDKEVRRQRQWNAKRCKSYLIVD